MWQNDYDQRLYYTCSGRDSIYYDYQQT
uniref:Uncharacterized protein n=1 Tax=Anguilla anguilla TaxID=7936 RepID=A0A0E9R642_ANGAN